MNGLSFCETEEVAEEVAEEKAEEEAEEVAEEVFNEAEEDWMGAFRNVFFLFFSPLCVISFFFFSRGVNFGTDDIFCLVDLLDFIVFVTTNPPNDLTSEAAAINAAVEDIMLEVVFIDVDAKEEVLEEDLDKRKEEEEWLLDDLDEILERLDVVLEDGTMDFFSLGFDFGFDLEWGFGLVEPECLVCLPK